MKHQKKMKKVLKVVATAALGGLVALSVFPTSQAKAATVDFNNLQPIQQFPGAAETDYVLNDYKASDKVPAGFTFFERFGAQTKMESFGVENTTLDTTDALHPDLDLKKDFRLFEANKNAKGQVGVWYREAGSYDGKTIDIKMTATDWDVFISPTNKSVPLLMFHKDPQIGTAFFGLNSMTIKREYFDHATGKPVKVSGPMTVTDLDSHQGVEIQKEGVSKLYIKKTSPLEYKETANSYVFFDPDFINADKGHATGDFDNGVGWNQDYMLTYLYTGTSITHTYFLDHVGLNHNKDTISYSTVVGFDTDGRKPAPSEVEKPTKTNSDTDETDQQHITLTNFNETFVSKVSHVVPAEFSTFFYKSYSIEDQIKPELNVVGTKVTNEDQKDVTSLFNITTTNNLVKAVLKNPADEGFYGHTYTLHISQQIKPGADVSKYIDKSGIVNIPNNATVFIDGDGYVTNDVETTPPTVVNPKVDKNVSDSDEKNKKDNITLENRNEAFTWAVNHHFGNGTYNWQAARLHDSVNEALDITAVKVLDKDGVDVTKSGKLTITGNEVQFDLSKVNGSYAYLTNQTYTLQIDTKIKSNVTSEQLTAFIKDGGIPNRGELVFTVNGKEDTVESNIPKVIPPAPVDPTVDKNASDADEKDQKDHITLANRNEVFTWKVNHHFGNGTYNWEAARLHDSVNAALDITAVKVLDKDGLDVTKSGKLTITGNEIQFDLSKVDGSYAYLANQTYTLLIDTKIKSTVTDEQLTAFIKDGGIPNQGELIFTLNGKEVTIESNIPKVIPPTPLVVTPEPPAPETPATVTPVPPKKAPEKKATPKTPAPKKATPVKETPKTTAKIPKTGDQSMILFVLGGLGLVAISVVLLRRKRKQDVTK
ncbi:isopeptide-forming domain-containing fimbrial protein [Listeria booriae]|uniref:isopeptide-forming domain-containing fimbrial protein n=1 Tax=Listeria booriae TaxID=1552123 RepID=UPI00162A277C|nr:isopeptide-forming domain-containing fimbrial protein [Listeria booriae]MBC1899067.1 isopeptide-forming domain-containing fimbrial protein [Listeria booriae]